MASGAFPKYVSGWGTPETFTMPFTPTRDGFCVCTLIPSTNSASYFYVKTDGNDYIRGSSAGGSSYNVSFPVKAGVEYYVSNSSNIATRVYTFIPFA